MCRLLILSTPRKKYFKEVFGIVSSYICLYGCDWALDLHDDKKRANTGLWFYFLVAQQSPQPSSLANTIDIFFLFLSPLILTSILAPFTQHTAYFKAL